MSFISDSQLRSYRKSVQLSYKTLNESLREFKAESKYFKTKIFLSHKHDELEHLEGAISFLKNHGVEVYVDWLDDGMPKTTSGVTAVRIKEKIKENDKFIFLATEAAINSKWCNWELGLGDAAKYINNIAILPIRKDNIEFSGSEYLQIYPYIVHYDDYKYELDGDLFGYWKPGTYVVFPKSKGNERVISLSDWLKS
ncbi:toll/interleukin-1 receptor domain-containing protein [Sphingobacterium sp. HJSM2_6]|uniref:toll/interleukin-1 receptor domain-containing protein n=1 Tax=Sphingobacterium sp. HJSM2_6 TaxID=3366264 RepID=UPI003BE0711F